MYYGTINGERYPKEIYNRLSKDKQKEFIEIDDDTMMELVNTANSTNKDIVVGKDGKPMLQDREISEEDAYQSELTNLKSFLNKSNYIAINYGALRNEDKKTLFLAETSDTFGMTNEEIFDKRDEAIDRINELRSKLST